MEQQPQQQGQRVKGNGFLGPQTRPDGSVSSEISIGVNIDGKEVEIPTLVPTLSGRERQWLLTNDISDPKSIPQSIIDKAVAHARSRMSSQQDVFADGASGPTPQPQRPFVADPNEWEVVGDDGNEYEVVEETKPATWSDKLGLNEPTASVGQGFLRGAGAGAVDLVQGAVSNITGQMNAKLDAENAVRQQASLPQTATAPRVESPGNFSAAVGGALPVMAEMAIGSGPVVKGAINAIPRAARAGEKFQEVMGAAKNIPIETKAVGDAALRISQLADRGGSMPLAVRKILNRMTDPNKAPMLYEESRDFASNISRLSANEFGRLTPAVAREVANLRVVLNQANAKAAELAGKGAEYKAAMREYAQAMRLRDAVDAVIKGAKKAAPVATAAGVGYWLTRQVKAALGSE